jgi:hypothetical protein
MCADHTPAFYLKKSGPVLDWQFGGWPILDWLNNCVINAIGSSEERKINNGGDTRFNMEKSL